MAATPTTKSQVQAYRFVLRRMEHALVRKDAVMLHDPMRTQVRATAVGLVLGILGLAAFALVSVFSPRDQLGDGTIFLGKESLTTYVAREEDGRRVLHPVLNLASARLVVGSAAPAEIVDDAALDEYPRGPLLGIPGAPSALPVEQDRPAAVWTACDRTVDVGNATTSPTDGAATTTSVLVGAPSTEVEGAARALGEDQALLVRAPDGTRQLLYRGTRAVVDPTDGTVARVLGLAESAARPVSAGLLNAVPEVPELAVPEVEGRGAAPGYAIGGGARVGDVVDVTGPEGTRYYLVRSDGVLEVGEVVASLLVSRTQDYVDLAASALARVPTSARSRELERFPDRISDVIDAAEAPVACLSWDGTASTESADGSTSFAPRLTLLAGTALPLPVGARVVPLAAGLGARATGTDTGLDSFYLQPGQGAVAQGRDTGQPAGDGTRYLVSDTGTRFGIDSADTAVVLGLGTASTPAPSSLLALLPQGAALDQASALRAHDGLARDRGVVQPVPGG